MFSTPFPYECMEMVVIYANTVFDDDMITLTNEERGSRMLAFVCNVERLLGAQAGVLWTSYRCLVEETKAAMNKRIVWGISSAGLGRGWHFSILSPDTVMWDFGHSV